MSTPEQQVKTPISKLGPLPKAPPPKVLVTKPGPPERITALVYGVPGIGKTTFADTFPDPFFIDIAGGMAAIRHHERPYIQPLTYQAFTLAVLQGIPEGTKTLVLDTITGATRMFLDDSISKTGREFPTQAEWLMVVEWLKRATTEVLRFPGHVVVTAQERFVKDEDTGKMIMGPAVPPSQIFELGAHFDCVFHMRIAFNQATGERSRKLLTEPDGLYQAKDRFGGLSKFEAPDFNHLMKKWSVV